MRHGWLALVVLAMTADPGAIGQDPGGIKGRLDAVVKAQAEAHRRFVRDLQDKTTEEAQTLAGDRYLREVARNAGEVLGLVRDHPKDPSAVEALRFVVETARGGPGDESDRAMEILLRDHVQDPGMGLLCGKLFVFRHSRMAEALLRAVLDRHPTREDRALACHSLATLLEYRARMVREVRQGVRPIGRFVHDALIEATRRLIDESDPSALDRESEALLERIVAEFADVKDWFTPDRALGPIAEGELFARRNLSEGKLAPEIVGKDHEGKTFALGDYRGKVVVVTFSASWCGPCVAMYPQERALVKTLEGRAFAMLGVNADADLATLKKSVDSGEITWRCWWDGGMDGPITTRWGVTAIPEVFVIDRAGVIRKRNVRGPELEKAVMALLGEEPAGRPGSK